MQVTGSNINGIKSVSIRVSSDGLSFFNSRGQQLNVGTVSYDNSEEIESQIRYLRKLSSKIRLISENENFVLIPKELYIESKESTYFVAKSLQYDSSRLHYRHIDIKGCKAIVSVDLFLIELISCYFEKIDITHPLVETIKGSLSTSSLVFYMTTSKRCAISYSRAGRLKFADYLPITSIIDLVYYINRLIAAHSIDQRERIGYIGSIPADLLGVMRGEIKNPIAVVRG